jgi:hypothetical protein
MCLSRLRLLAVLAVPTFLIAQHSSISQTPSPTAAPSTSSVSHTTPSAPSSGGSASTTHSTTSTTSTTAPSHSSPPETHNSAATTHNSAASRTSVAPSSRKADTDFARKPVGDTKRATNLPRQPIEDAKKIKQPSPPKPVDPGKGSRWAFWRHPAKRSITPVDDAEARKRKCLKPPCAVCPPGTTAGKGGSCTAAPIAQTQTCPIGQSWNGALCVPESCPAGQTRVGASCRADCTTHTAGAQNLIMELRSARQRKNEACRLNPTGQECLQAEAHYNLLFNEYEGFLGGVPFECRATLPAAIAI